MRKPPGFFPSALPAVVFVARAKMGERGRAVRQRHCGDNAQMTEWIILPAASLLAGFVDAIVGGGGLILVPALFAVFPSTPPATLFGTNKSASVWGTAAATWRYARRVAVPWTALLPAAAVCALGAWLGAWAVTVLPPDGLRRALPFILTAVLAYTLMRKDLGRHHAPRFAGRAQAMVASAVGGTIGFYDGFFGPGTGSFLVFLFVRVLGYDFLRASASAVVCVKLCKLVIR